MKIARVIVASLLIVSCTDEALTTTDDRCGYGERHLEYVPAITQQLDVLIVVDPALAVRIQARIASLLEALATSNIDDYPERDLYANHLLRVAVVSPAEAARFYRAPDRPVPFVRHRYAPYGYSEDVASFVARALCLQSADAVACASAPEDAERPFAHSFAIAYVISDRDACPADEPTNGSGPACDAALTELLTTLNDLPDPARSWEVTLVAGVPAALGTLSAANEVLDGQAALDRLLADPSFRAAGADGDVCAGTAGGIAARPTPELVRLANTRRILSVCAATYREATAMQGPCVVADGLPLLLEGIEQAQDGTYVCELRELLPADGAITRCEQLAAFGRDAMPIAIEDGREVCVVQQVTEARAEDAFGWYVPSRSETRTLWHGAPEAGPQCSDAVFRSTTALAVTATASTEWIAGSRLQLTCALRQGSKLASCQQS
jgi:hypothetical protein